MSIADLTKDQYALLLRAARKITDSDERDNFFQYVGSRVRMGGPEDLLGACRDGLQLFGGTRRQCRGCS
jgi:hypothetical protein